jgi:HK97 gp10 family phage protein
VVNADFSETTRFAADLGKVAPRVVKQAAAAVRLATLGTERDAKILAPVDTGNLRNSITSTIRGLTGVVGPTADYGEHVERGTSRMGPQPYMGPATDRNGALFNEAMKAISGEVTP